MVNEKFAKKFFKSAGNAIGRHVGFGVDPGTKIAMEIAMKISDGLMRDDAVHRIVDLCMKANDLKTAQILFRAIHTSWIREVAQRDHPALVQ